jgi:diguanylate cyclase (GGDEF)-like protein/PAS domain S-box-containing protein
MGSRVTFSMGARVPIQPGVSQQRSERVPLQGLQALPGRLRDLLPQGRGLPDAVWRRRHRALLTLLWLNAIGLPLFGIAQGYGVFHSAQEGLVLVALAGLAMLAGDRKRLAAGFVSLGLISSSAILVHLWGGVIEAHFYFFVMIVLLSLYEDWVPFLLAAAYVVIHHGVTGALDPDSVYNHQSAVDHPWRWAAVHALFVTGAGVGAVTAWRLNEDVRAETREAYRRALESEERFKSAFDNAPIGMVLASIGHDDLGRLLQVNHAMCEMAGRSEEELLGKSLLDVAHPDDAEQTAALLESLLDEDQASHQIEVRCTVAEGRELWCLLNVSLVRDGSGEPLYAIAQLEDVSARKRAREQLAYNAYHDSLTGLANRRLLVEDLEREMASARDETLLLLLFDLDGFKAYNDAFGHPAGDALLSRLGQSLAEATADRATAYRMGGDEFCVLGAVAPEEEHELTAAAAAALCDYGESFSITASYGSVALPLGAASPEEALRKADQRLYARKGRVRTSAGRQATDALMTALSERSPALGDHLDDVTDHCRAVARALRLPEEEVTPLLQAAELHDIGKVGIPDAILGKPGPLDQAAWELMRTHTLIGERILSAAPALAAAARVVRSTHERFDGRGYPDGLAGADIPLGSRIIAVCDAYQAMTSERPYRRAMSPEDAIAELRSNSGTQFDPVVVAAFVGSLADRKGAPAAPSDPALRG